MSRALVPPLALLALLLALACDSGDETQPVGIQPTSATATTPTTPEPGSTFVPFTPGSPTPTPRPSPQAEPFPDDLRDDAEALLTQIGDVRGTPPRRDVDMYVLTREQARAYYLGEEPTADDEAPTDSTEPEEAAPAPFNLKQATYVLLGMIPSPEQDPAGRDLQEQQIDNLIDLLTGFYDNDFMAFYLVDSISGGIYGSLARSTIVHELTHALQYQYRDIDGLVTERAGNWDATNALLDVLEGDAVYTETLVLGFSTRSTYREPVCFEIPAPQRANTPYVVERELDTWYEDGLCFVAAVRDKLTRGITGVFEDLPGTTEQILHPDKYLAGEGARPVFLNALSDTLGPGWQQQGRGSFGEFGLQNILLTGLADDRERVWDAAAGWGGDSFFFYQAYNGDQLLHLEIRWDTEPDAREFYDALVDSLVNRGGDPLPEDETTDHYRTVINDTTWSTTVAADRVTLLVSTNPAAIEAAAPLVE
jgi:hypothetical protein